jgi:hypothetical protein
MARVKVVSPELSSVALPRNFRISTAESVRAMGIGVPSYAARKRRIEDMIEDFADFLDEHEQKLTKGGMARTERDEALRRAAGKLDLAAVNRLIEAHNRYYPIEANLPTDPRTGAYMVRRGAPFEPEPAVTIDDLLAALDAARAKRSSE